jgi:predicted small lipoprotein YifL
MRTVLPAVLLALAIAGCGQKGDLYLRDKPPPGFKPKAETYKPVPYPENIQRDPPAK